MEIKISTTQILKVLQVLSWIIFIGLCVEAGGIVFNTFFTLVLNPNGAANFWEADFSAVHQYDRGHFAAIALVMIIVAVLKAIMFYLIVKLFVDKKLNIYQPFSPELRRFILNLSYLAIGIGFFSAFGARYADRLSKQEVQMPDLQSLHMAGADVWLFMGVILIVIAQIVKRGIEIQNENNLTI